MKDAIQFLSSLCLYNEKDIIKYKLLSNDKQHWSQYKNVVIM